MKYLNDNTKHSYLTKSCFIEREIAEISLGSLCLNYLSFDCFEQNILGQQLKGFLVQGSFGFQDYASSHWSDHTCAVIKLGPSAFVNHDEANRDFASALIDFVSHYDLAAPTSTETQDSSDKDYLQYKDLGYFDDVCCISQCIRLHRAKGQQALDEIFPKPLKLAVMSNRAILEQFAGQASLDQDAKNKLEQYYGRKWYKCTKAACYYFHEGFLEEKMRDYHIVRHEQPFRCPYAECESGYKLGFTTARQREKHMSIYHPEDVKIQAIFARVRKDREQSNDSRKQSLNNSKHPAKFVCDTCSKAYTRKEKLNNHLRTHTSERVQFQCSVSGCQKTFSRDDERKRHEKEIHLGEKNHSCVYKLKAGIPGSVHGCGKAFPRPSALHSHWRSSAGQACLKPLHEEEERERQWQEQISRRIAEGFELPLPQALYDQFPHLRESISGELTPTATEIDGQNIVNPNYKKWQPFRSSPRSDTPSSQGGAGTPFDARH